MLGLELCNSSLIITSTLILSIALLFLTDLFVEQIPIGSEDSFSGLVDLVRMKAVVWNGEELGAAFEDTEIPEDLVEIANEYRYKNIVFFHVLCKISNISVLFRPQGRVEKSLPVAADRVVQQANSCYFLRPSVLREAIWKVNRQCADFEDSSLQVLTFCQLGPCRFLVHVDIKSGIQVNV